MSSSVASSSTTAAALRAAAAPSNVGSTSRTRLLRGSLSSRPGPGGPTGSFHLPCRKIVLEYCPHGASSKGTRRFVIPTALADVPDNRAASAKGKAKAAEYRSQAVLETSRAIDVARAFPSVEFVVKENPNKHPLLRGFYSELLESFCFMTRGSTRHHLPQQMAGPKRSHYGIWNPIQSQRPSNFCYRHRAKRLSR